MSEFKIACPNCNQNIGVTSEYSGQQISCPSCQTVLIVPDDPNAPASAPGKSKLSMAATTPHEQASSGAAAASHMYAAAAPKKKKKSLAGLIGGIAAGVCAIAAIIYFWPTIMNQLRHHNVLAAKAEQVDTNTPPPPPPPLTTEEIFQKVSETYKGMTDYAAKAKTDASIDMSALVPGKNALNMSTTSSLQLGRTNNYRLEWEQNIAGKTTKGAAYSSGKGNFIGYGPYPPSKVKTRDDALLPVSANFFLLSDAIAELFFADTNSVAEAAKSFTKTNASDNPNGHECYVLTGEANHQNLLIWVDKSTFLIARIALTLGETIPEAELKALPSAQRNALATVSKLKGTITETYDNIQTNQNLVASVFETPYQPNANTPAAQPQQRQPRASSLAGQLTNPKRRGQ
jgi:outer membrane lipoprotein-sorting protein